MLPLGGGKSNSMKSLKRKLSKISSSDGAIIFGGEGLMSSTRLLSVAALLPRMLELVGVLLVFTNLKDRSFTTEEGLSAPDVLLLSETVH